MKEFERDLDFFLRHYPVLKIDDLRSAGTWQKPGKPGFILTFDDGLSQFYDEIAPLLLRKGIPAICFLNPDFIDNKGLFYRYKASILIDFLGKQSRNAEMIGRIRKTGYSYQRVLDDIAIRYGIDFNEYLTKKKPYLTFSQINSLISKGFVFGAHSMDHPQYSELSLHQQIWQTKSSLDLVEAITNQKSRLFAFPFTDHGVSKDFFEKVFDHENPIADLTFGCAGLKKDSRNKNIQRIPMEEGNFKASEIIYGEYMYYLAKSIVRKNLIRR